MAAWLSSRIRVSEVGLFFTSEGSCLSQRASCAALASAMYSASAVERATYACVLLLQLIAAPPM